MAVAATDLTDEDLDDNGEEKKGTNSANRTSSVKKIIKLLRGAGADPKMVDKVGNNVCIYGCMHWCRQNAKFSSLTV
jgi:hypothetical protein